MTVRIRAANPGDFRIINTNEQHPDAENWIHIANSCILGLNTLMDFCDENGVSFNIGLQRIEEEKPCEEQHKVQ